MPITVSSDSTPAPGRTPASRPTLPGAANAPDTQDEERRRSWDSSRRWSDLAYRVPGAPATWSELSVSAGSVVSVLQEPSFGIWTQTTAARLSSAVLIALG